MTSPPTGTVTFLFTDIEGSTKLWEQNPAAMSEALARHDEILRNTMEMRGGYVFKTVGDAFCAAFANAKDALEAALFVQRALVEEEWAFEIGALKVRMALHTGAAQERDGDYFGPPVNRVARLLSAAHGGQVLLSAATHEMARDQLPDGASLMDLEERHLKDLFRPERIFQLTAPGLPSEFPPLRTLEARPNNLPLQPTPLVGREREVGEVCPPPWGNSRLTRGRGLVGGFVLELRVSEETLDEALHEMAKRATRIVEQGRVNRNTANTMLDDARSLAERRVLPAPREVYADFACPSSPCWMRTCSIRRI